jgi:hypothetical protein
MLDEQAKQNMGTMKTIDVSGEWIWEGEKPVKYVCEKVAPWLPVRWTASQLLSQIANARHHAAVVQNAIENMERLAKSSGIPADLI